MSNHLELFDLFSKLAQQVEVHLFIILGSWDHLKLDRIEVIKIRTVGLE